MTTIYTFPQFSDNLRTAQVALYTNVSNMSLIRSRIIAAATSTDEIERAAINFAFVDAKMITSPRHLQTAIYQAMISCEQQDLRTKTVHSEVLWALNPTHNITEAIRRYGVSDTTTSLFVIRIGPQTSSVKEAMDAAVDGQSVSIHELAGITDWKSVAKYNKLNSEPKIVLNHAAMDKIVTSAVAMKSVLA